MIADIQELGLAWAFLPDREGFQHGLILVGVARCFAMVLVWTGLAGRDGKYCAILVAINSILQTVLFTPLATLFINLFNDTDHDDTNIS